MEHYGLFKRRVWHAKEVRRLIYTGWSLFWMQAEERWERPSRSCLSVCPRCAHQGGTPGDTTRAARGGRGLEKPEKLVPDNLDLTHYAPVSTGTSAPVGATCRWTVRTGGVPGCDRAVPRPHGSARERGGLAVHVTPLAFKGLRATGAADPTTRVHVVGPRDNGLVRFQVPGIKLRDMSSQSAGSPPVASHQSVSQSGSQAGSVTHECPTRH